MIRALVFLLALATACGGETPRTEIMLGFATDIKAPDLIDGVQLRVVRADNGISLLEVPWAITGSSEPFNLPGSYGIYSDGEEIRLDLTLTGLRGTREVVSRKAVLNLVEGKTLFFRMGLTAGCIDKQDCTSTQSCVEGACVEREVNSLQLPDFEPALVTEVTCTPAVQYIDTSTGLPMPPSDDADECPPELCFEGTCLKPPPPQTEPRTVTGSKITTFIRPNAFENAPVDLSADPPSALVPDGAGGYTTIAGVGASDGSFAIADVPAGTYLLKDGSDYFATSSSTFDLGTVAEGRANTVAATATTSITLNVSNMSAFADTDQLEAASAGANTWWFLLEQSVAVPTNATALTSYTISTDFSTGTNLIANDDFTLLHLASKQASGGLPYNAVTQAFRPAPFTQSDGGTTTVSGAFIDLPQSNMFAGRFRPAAWDAASGFDGTNLNALGPAATEIVPGLVYGIQGQVAGTVYGLTGATADFLVGQIPHGAEVAVDGASFGYPFPVSEVWGRVFTASVLGTVAYQLPGTTNQVRLGVGLRVDQVVGTVADPVVPTLGPVQMPTIDGLDLFQPQSALSETPTIAWQPPMLGTPTQYVVSVHELAIANGKTTRTRVARLFTTGTSIVVPPGIFIAGRAYALQIQATTTPNPSAPRRFRLPSATSTVASAQLGMGPTQGTAPECAPCQNDQDCLRGTCSNNVCIATPTTVTTSLGTMIPGYVRADGAILLAHYGAGTFHSGYDPQVSQEVTVAGGVTPPVGWAPDPCRESGHLSFAEWDPTARSVIIECGDSATAPMGSFESSTLFSSFASSSYGTVGASGTPGWSMIAAIGSGQGRSSHASCGGSLDNLTGGIAYCDGPGVPSSFSNHVASYFTSQAANGNFVGCMGTGCNGPACSLQIWVWLK
jgi:hypothetical protein